MKVEIGFLKNYLYLIQNIFIEEFLMKSASDCIVNKSFFLFGLCSSLILKNGVFIPPSHKK